MCLYQVPVVHWLRCRHAHSYTITKVPCPASLLLGPHEGRPCVPPKYMANPVFIDAVCPPCGLADHFQHPEYYTHVPQAPPVIIQVSRGAPAGPPPTATYPPSASVAAPAGFPDSFGAYDRAFAQTALGGGVMLGTPAASRRGSASAIHVGAPGVLNGPGNIPPSGSGTARSRPKKKHGKASKAVPGAQRAAGGGALADTGSGPEAGPLRSREPDVLGLWLDGLSPHDVPPTDQDYGHA
ncbi:hypothetical protein C8Q77DRAFT_666588 [Trametes polyzona]|nr:hypothetical protein C8Q77DRAFT_666588 [Trametes polyzona]